jgi:hypothetical protein
MTIKIGDFSKLVASTTSWFKRRLPSHIFAARCTPSYAPFFSFLMLKKYMVFPWVYCAFAAVFPWSGDG